MSNFILWWAKDSFLVMFAVVHALNSTTHYLFMGRIWVTVSLGKFDIVLVSKFKKSLKSFD
jgi:hypothetical protein